MATLSCPAEARDSERRRALVNAVGDPVRWIGAVEWIVQKDVYVVADFGTRSPIELGVGRRRMFLDQVWSFPVFDDEHRMPAPRSQRGDSRIEVRVEPVPSEDGTPGVIPRAATLLHGDDDGPGRQR